MPALRRRTLVAVPALVLGLGLTACSINEQTQGWYDPTDGSNVESGDIDLRNIVVVAAEDGAATVLATFANSGEDDGLVEAHVGEVVGEPADGVLEIPAGGRAAIGPDETRLDLLDTEAEAGRYIEVEFVFERAPRVSLDVLVQSDEGLYENAVRRRATPPTPVPDTESPTPADDEGTAAPTDAESPATDDETPTPDDTGSAAG